MSNMSKSIEWDFALELSGITPESLPMSALADYLALWAGLIGVEHRPVFKGVIKGSTVLRAKVGETDRVSTAVRLRNAANDDKVRPLLDKLEKRLESDGIRGAKVIDREGKFLQLVRTEPKSGVDELTVTDAAQVDGRVWRISGKDESTSVGLIEDGTGLSLSVETTNDDLARRFARHFKGELLRVQVHGTWTRNASGRWEPKSLKADEFEVLEDAPLVDTMRALRQAPGNGWAALALPDALAAWRNLRHGPEEKQESEKQTPAKI
jgi:hypothetical protein